MVSRGTIATCTCGHSPGDHAAPGESGGERRFCLHERCSCEWFTLFAPSESVPLPPPGPTEPFGGLEKPLGVDSR